MSADLQAKLLRALEEQEICPVGGSTLPIDVRVVAATNVDLEKRIAAGTFRADLYYRIAGCTLQVLALRHRRSDIGELVEHFVRSYSAESGKTVRGVTVKALRHLIAYDWPGNVRELEHEVRRLVYTCRAGQAIGASLLSDRITGEATATLEAPEPMREAESTGQAILKLAELERQAIIRALKTAGGKRIAAARLLGISRDTLRRRLNRYGLQPGSGRKSNARENAR